MFPIGLTSRARYSSKTFALFFVLAGLGWTLLPRIPERGVARPPAVNAPRPDASTRAGEAYGRLPLSFEANEGQTDPEVKFLARGDGYKLFLTGNGAVIQLRKTERGSRKEEGVASSLKSGDPRTRERDGQSAKTAPQASVLRMSLVGANERARVEAEGALAGKSNYLIGSDPSKWRTNVPHFSRVRYDEVYPGVGLVFYGNRRRLEYDFHVAPGADPNTIRLAFSGARQVRVEEESGDLLLSTPGGELRQHKPFIFQEAGGARREIAGRYVILQTPDTNRQTPDAGRKAPNSALPTRASHADSFLVGFEVAGYDSALPLVIDPVLSYSTYLGGGGSDVGDGVELDAFGNAYISGSTDATDFPTASPLQAANAGSDDFFVTKLNADGSALIYSTYIGGSGDESSPDIALDERGHLYLTGGTRSNNFPTVTPIQAALVGTQDAAVLKLNPEGSALLYSTYLGGTDAGFEAGFGIAVNRAGQAFVAGQTSAPADFPTAAPFQAANAGSFDGFVSKLNAAGSALLYSTYLGGSDFDRTFAVAVDLSGNAYVVGQTRSNNFPTASPLDATLQGTDDGFVTKFNAAGSALLYSTYVGGSAIDATSVVKVDAAGNAYVNGDTTSNDFPVQNALQPTFGGGANDAFAFKLNAAGSAFIYSTYLGGTGNDSSGGCAIDAAGNFYLTGSTDSTDFPVTNALQPALNGGDDIFLSKIDADGAAFAYSTYLGGSGFESGGDVVVDEFGNAYVGGETDSTDYPFTAGAFQTASGGGNTDSFFTKVSEFGSCSVPSYAAAAGSPFATGDAPSAVAVGDFDLDGHADLAVTNQGTGDDISILPGNGDGTFGAAINVPLAAGANPAAITVADFNNDGFPDLATANSGASNTTVLLNDGSGASFASQDFTTGTNPLSIVAGDWDGDGDTDLAVANFDDDTLNTLKSDGTGVFPTITTFATGDGPRALAVADFNLDGHLDLAIAQQNGQTVPVSLNDGAATFPIAAGTATGGPPVSIAVADFNLDGFPDAVTANSTAQNVTILLGNGGATFASASNFPVAGGSSVNAVAAGDFNHDNRPDVAVVNGSGVSVLLGNGAGALGTASVVGAVTGSPATLVSGDFDEDTRPDFASVNPTADSAPVLLSGCGLAAGSALVVNSANDVDDGSCDATHCSLREAINASNALAGTDSISFNIAGAGPHTISPATPLPAITDPAVIDGTTEPDFAVGAPVVELAGNLGAAGSGGLVVSADGSTVRGLVINRFDDTGLVLNSDGNTVTGNFIGTDTTGTLDLGNGAHGIYLNGSNSNQIGGATVAERNVISGNGGEGIRAEFASSNNLIRGNHIGTNAAGTAALGNSGHGVIFDASGAGATNNDIGGSSSSHRNVISGNGQHGVVLRNTVATGNRVRGNFIGTNAAGTADLGNAANGVFLETAPSNTVGGASAGEGNVISGNGQHGVHVINAAASGNLVAGNFIGTDASGTADLGNTLDGVAVDAAPSTTIGGTTGTTRNVISGNDRNGVFINGNAAASNVVLGNLIGVSVAGTAALGNTNVGVLIGDAPSNTVGGATAAARNVISANAGGVAIEFAGATGNVVRGNYIGTDSTGTVDLGNTSAGVRVSGPAGNSIIGGSAAGEGNLLSGNTDVGVRLDNSTGNTVQGNFIGTDAAGTSALANQRGVLVNNSSNNTVGGALGGSGNRIAFNTNDGVLVLGGTGNALLKNVTFSNGTTAQHLGIDLGADDGVTANDAGDADTGANNLQNFPLLAAANPSNGGTTLTVTGTLNSTASTNFSVEFFSNAACDAAGNGEGRTFLGTVNVTTDATGNAAINTILGTPAAIGEAVTATATGPTNNTSEFSPCVTVTAAATATWTGAASADWHTAGNWDSGVVPTATEAVVIPSGVLPNEPTISTADATVASVSVQSGRVLTLSNSRTLMASTVTTAPGSALFVPSAQTGIVNAALTLGGTLGGADATSLFRFDGAAFINNGDVSINSFRFGGAAQALSGAGAFTSGTAQVFNGSTVTLAGDHTLAALAIVSGGVFDQGASFNLVLTTLSVLSGGTFRNLGVGDLTVGGSVANAGLITLDGGGAACGDADSILVRSSSAGVQRAWGGAGTFSLTDVDVRDQAGAAAVVVRNGTDSGNNGANWTFTVCAAGTTLTVNATDDADDGACDLSHCSLREAINTANSTPGQLETIAFNIPGAGPHTIQPAAPLPVVNDPAVIDATTQPGFSTTPLVELDGTSAGATANGLSITAGGTTVRGLAINRFGAGGSSGGAGILLASGGGNVVENCFLGLTPAGVVAPNNFDGVSINGSNNNRVGGVAARRNVISGNERNGVLVFNGSTGNQIEGNQIGTDASGALPRPNGSHGVEFSGASSNAVGSLAGGRSNHIAFNGANGVSVQSGTGNTVHANRISSNAGLGINLGADGVTPHDAGDGDTGPNNLQNFPFLTSATSNGVNTNIGVLFISTPNSAFTLNFYSSPTCDPSGNGEGETFIGTRAANTNNNGTDSSPASFPVGVLPGSFITATATDAAGNTSEFSPCQVVAGQTFSLSGTVLSPANVGIVGINLTLGGTQTATTTTDPSGNYTFNGLAQGGNFTVTPSETNFVFNPPGRAVNNLQADQTGLDFTGTIVNHTITGTIHDEGGQGIADVLVTLSGALSAITRTDQQGNFAFPSVPTNGSFTVTPEKEGFTFDPPRQVINAINANVRFEAVGTPQPSPTPTPDPSDDFSGDVIDPDRWSFGILTNPPPAFDPRLGVFQSGGLLHVQPRANVHGPSFNGLVSVRALDFDASPFVSVEVVQPAQGEGAQTVFGLGTNGDNWFRFVVEDASPPTPRASGSKASTGPASSSKTKQAASASTAAPSAMPTPSPLNILFQIAIGGAKFSSDPTAFDPSQHRFWRFRHDAPASLVIFETSPDALVWREQFRAEIDRGQTALIAELSAGTTRPNQNPGEALFDNFLLTPSPRLRFTTGGAAASEAAGTVSVEVQRTGSAESPVSVNFTTSDGTATAGSDYTATSGTLTFATGETLKTISVPVNNDAAIEPDETIRITLSNPVGGSLGPITTATLTILDDDRTSNPIDRSEFFVSQHYRDFLGRDPDEDGLEFWTNNIESCGAEAACRDIRRVDTSAAFFLSLEFQGTGYFVHRLYEASFDRAPAFAEYLPDLQAVRQGVIIGEPGATQLLAANKRAFATLFANRPDFRARYDHLNEMQYVDALFANAGVTPSEGERTALIAGLLTNRETRAGVLQQVIEDEQFISREFNRAFVRMQYFGYLRRDPDPPGFAFWLKKLEDNGGDFRAAEMVKAFITSFEYRQRFGQP
ncbi:MAG TPA: FG-GAP-like repeat-containing protein [Pyrinomonadaceae bacterium]|nr:FG-GAP-like repeat-containing protein [Pyrinomonadaceae bacterium]